MGCTNSKLDNEDTVRRCKERRRLIKDAVYARHHLAAAHSDYCRSLRLTGSSLSSFASHEPLTVSPHTPSVLIPNSHVSSSPPPPPPRHVSPSPPFPPRHVSPSPPPPIPPATSSASQRRYYKKPNPSMKLPHILSESESPHSRIPNNFTYKANPTYSETQSQTDGMSSVWNWENFYPPSPPGSEFFDRRNPDKIDDKSSVRSESFDRFSVKSESFRNRDKKEDDKSFVHSNSFDKSSVRSKREDFKPSVHSESFDRSSVRSERFQTGDKREDDKASVYSEAHHKSGDLFDRRSNKGEDGVHKYNYKQQQNINEYHGGERGSVYSDFFDKRSNKTDDHHHLDVEEEEGEETEREEVQYSEWDDHYNTTTSSSSDERESARSEIRPRSNFGSERRAVPPKKLFDDGASSVSWNNARGGGKEMSNDMRMVVRHRDLVEIVAAIKEYFDKAASAGEQVGEMLETGRAQLDRSFSKLKKTVYHSSGVFSNLSSSWTSKPPLAVKYQFEPSSIVEPGGSKSLCSTLERLLAWEKKLYQEVKAREGVKIENEKKLSSLQSQECRGDNVVKLDKTKSEIKRLQSLIVVTSQAVSTTSSAIIGVRDAELVPQLVELCHGFMYMWRSMNQFHEVQNQIVQQVRGLVNQSMKGESTSDLHRQATRDLESAVSAWHSSFCRLIKFQRDFIRNLHGWFKLTLLPITGVPFNGIIENSDAFSFYDEWKLALERVPDTVASEAIKSFINVVHSISLKQTEELKIKKRTETASKELEKKSSSLRKIEKKYYHSYSLVGIGLPNAGPDNGHVLDARDPLADKKFELESCRRKVEDEMLRHSKAVENTRAMTLNNIQTGLPGVFQAMTSFSALIMESLETVCTRSYAIK